MIIVNYSINKFSDKHHFKKQTESHSSKVVSLARPYSKRSTVWVLTESDKPCMEKGLTCKMVLPISGTGRYNSGKYYITILRDGTKYVGYI